VRPSRPRSDPVTTASLDAPHPPAPRPPGRADDRSQDRPGGRTTTTKRGTAGRSAGRRAAARARAASRSGPRRERPARGLGRGARCARRPRAERGESEKRREKRGSGCRGSGCRGHRGPQAATQRHRDGHEARWRRSRARAPGAASRVHMRGGALGSRLPPEPLHTAHSTRRVVCARERRAGGKRAVIRVIRGGRLVRLRQATGLAAG
jgi:hypothetical protein